MNYTAGGSSTSSFIAALVHWGTQTDVCKVNIMAKQTWQEEKEKQKRPMTVTKECQDFPKTTLMP